MRPFLVDEEIARRLRAIETKLQAHGLPALADEAAELAELLEPLEAA